MDTADTSATEFRDYLTQLFADDFIICENIRVADYFESCDDPNRTISYALLDKADNRVRCLIQLTSDDCSSLVDDTPYVPFMNYKLFGLTDIRDKIRGAMRGKVSPDVEN